jgi:hypothetical protein
MDGCISRIKNKIMAKNTTGYFLANQTYTQTSLTNTTLTTIATGAANDSWVYDIVITTNSITPVLGTLYMNIGSPNPDFTLKKILAAAPIQAGQGITTTNPYRLLQSSDGSQVIYRFLDRDQNFYIPLDAGHTLKFQIDSGLSSGATVNILVFQRDF